MQNPIDLMLRHGEVVLFVAVFQEEAGFPLPAVPFILAGGALAGAGKLSVAPMLALGAAAATLGDMLWYLLGRRRGGKILSFLCRISLEPDSCVGTAKSFFERHRSRGLILAKFVPAFGSVMPPLAGMFGIGITEFLLFDGFGSLLYVGSYGAFGYFFSSKLRILTDAAESMGSIVALLVGAGLLGYVAWKWSRRRAFLKKIDMARITVKELRSMQEAGKDVLVFDVRSSLDLKLLPRIVPGARWIPKEEFHNRHQEIPRDHEVVLYCSCPNDASAAKMALILQKHGIERVRPLLGGIDAWIENGFRTEPAPVGA
jgi:membrane protein DedA with SNARE-associated domain/rhodanese-related sulfurtransferase